MPLPRILCTSRTLSLYVYVLRSGERRQEERLAMLLQHAWRRRLLARLKKRAGCFCHFGVLLHRLQGAARKLLSRDKLHELRWQQRWSKRASSESSSNACAQLAEASVSSPLSSSSPLHVLSPLRSRHCGFLPCAAKPGKVSGQERQAHYVLHPCLCHCC